MAKYHILFGFEINDTSKQILSIVRSQKSDVVCASRTTKEGITDYLRQQPGCNTLVLREVLETEAYTAEELAALNDTKSYNIVVVVDSSHRGKDFMQILYAAGITSALLIDSKGGATAPQIADLILNPRTRKQARKYYGMTEVKAKINMLTSDVYMKNYALLMDESRGLNIIDRYIMIVKSLPVNQAVDFTRKLPPNVMKRLMEYEEYYKIQDIFRMKGYRIKIRRPKNLKRGMTDEAFIQAISGKKGKKIIRRIQQEAAQHGAVSPAVHASKPTGTTTPPVKKSTALENVEEQDLFASNVFANGSIVKKGLDMTTGVPGSKDGTKTNSSEKRVTNAKPVVGKGTVTKVGSAKPAFSVPAGKISKKSSKNGKEKARINWKFLIVIAVVGILLLIIWYFLLSTTSLM